MTNHLQILGLMLVIGIVTGCVGENPGAGPDSSGPIESTTGADETSAAPPLQPQERAAPDETSVLDTAPEPGSTTESESELMTIESDVGDLEAFLAELDDVEEDDDLNISEILDFQ